MRVAIDWGTTNRRGYLLDDQGRCVREAADAQGMLAARGRFPEALRAMCVALDAPPDSSVLLSGMVGAAQGWVHAPYLSTDIALDRLGDHLTTVDVSDGAAVHLVPGMRFTDGVRIDVMRGEETQLFGAVAGGVRSGWFVLPGTHSKWVQVVDGRIAEFWTFMTGEMYELVLAHGTLASLGQAREFTDDAFEAGVAASNVEPVMQALFGCRAQVVGGALRAARVAARVSGVLIGAEFTAMAARVRKPPQGSEEGSHGVLHVIGSPALSTYYARAARWHGLACDHLDAREVYLKAAATLRPKPSHPW